MTKNHHYAALMDLCREAGITVEEYRSKYRHQPLATYRHMIQLTLADGLGMQMVQIAKLSHRNHASIIHAIARIRPQAEIYPDLRDLRDRLMAVIHPHRIAPEAIQAATTAI